MLVCFRPLFSVPGQFLLPAHLGPGLLEAMRDGPSLFFPCKTLIGWALINTSPGTLEFSSTFPDMNVFWGHLIFNVIFNPYFRSQNRPG